MDLVAEVDKAINYSKQKQYKKAEKIYKSILSVTPDNSVVLSLLGLMYLDWGYLLKAEKFLVRAYKIKPSQPTVEGLAIVKKYLKRKDYIKYVESAVDDTRNFKIYDSYISYLLYRKKHSKALEYAEKSLKLFPLNPKAYARLIEAYIHNGKFKEAYSLSLKLTSSHKDYYAGWLWLGMCYEIIFHDDLMAKECFEKVLKLGNKVDGYSNLSVNACKRFDYEKSLEYLGKLKRLKNNTYNTDFSYATVYMKKREFKKGLKYYSRYIHFDAITDEESKSKLLKNYWDGKRYKDETLFIYGDQGVGDLIMFSRYIPFVSRKFKTVKVLVRKNVLKLFRKSFKSLDNVKFYSKSIPKYDKSAILSCLAYYLKMDYSDIPFSDGYLISDNKKDKKYKKLINSDKFKVGICWEAGAAGWREQLNRTLNVAMFDELLKNKNIQFYSLQVNPSMDNYKEYKELIDLGSGFEDFSDTAGAMKNLDLVITVDTSVAHLAGALGVKTFMLLPYCTDWRWFDDEKTTPWYKSVTIFKQKNPKSWEDVIVSLTKETEKII